ncbi:cysteine desulfurase family protein [Nigerium massiliense]|uniref:cysteine desulfurase family protein n=1 Tax=Nigerium massiliense TaxID=1522317 RepID=UPI00058ECB69|nr:cysteine desulfurase family protein [Nigerium massiliense]
MADYRYYLDYAASAPLRPEVGVAMAAVAARAGNPSSLHGSGRVARAALEGAREQVAAAVGALPAEVVFTSGGTEADNIAVLGGVSSAWAREAGRTRLVTTSVEHPAVAEAATTLADRTRVVGVDDAGRLDEGEWMDALDGSVAVASAMWANNETGVIFDVASLAEAAHRAGAWAHSDGVQALGHVPVSFADSGLDLLSLSAHKVGGPVGVGALVVRRGLEPAPVMYGGGQERKLRSGTVSVALAVGFAAAAELAVAELAAEASRIGGLRERVVAAISGIEGARVNGEGTSPAICNATFAGLRADDLLLMLDAAGVDCSTGSACTAGVHRPSEVLLAMGRSEADASASVRFSFGWATTDDDVEALVGALPDAVGRARAAYAW